MRNIIQAAGPLDTLGDLGATVPSPLQHIYLSGAYLAAPVCFMTFTGKVH